MMIAPSMSVQRSEFLRPVEAVRIDGQAYLGRFAWSRLMRLVAAPWPEESLEPDTDFPRDSPP